jgi:hypothetical protein
VPARLPVYDLREARQTLESALAANRAAARRHVDLPYGAGAIRVMQRRIEAAEAAERRRAGRPAHA